MLLRGFANELRSHTRVASPSEVHRLSNEKMQRLCATIEIEGRNEA